MTSCPPLKLPLGSQTVSNIRSILVGQSPERQELQSNELCSLQERTVMLIVRERGGVLARPQQPEGSFHEGGLRIKYNLALSSVLLARGNNSPWIPCQELSKEQGCLAYVEDIRCINMLLGDDGNKYSNQGLGFYQQGSCALGEKLPFHLRCTVCVQTCESGFGVTNGDALKLTEVTASHIWKTE